MTQVTDSSPDIETIHFSMPTIAATVTFLALVATVAVSFAQGLSRSTPALLSLVLSAVGGLTTMLTVSSSDVGPVERSVDFFVGVVCASFGLVMLLTALALGA